MARLDYGDGDGTLWLRLSLLERFGACVTHDLALPLAAIRSVRATDDAWSELRGVRAPGSGIPGLLALGTRRHSLGRDFVAIYGKGPAVVVELVGVRLARLVVSSRDAGDVAGEIRDAAAETQI
jgi:hypothetical protein